MKVENSGSEALMAQMTNKQIYRDGANALALIESAAPPQKTPEANNTQPVVNDGPKGQNIDVQA